jgi:ABC-2 type transport system permease protein
MIALAAISRREFSGFFSSIGGWVIGAILVFLTGIVFLEQVFHNGSIATLRHVLDLDAVVLLVICPAISMRSICGDRSQRVLSLMRASPASVGSIVVGKFLANLAVLIVLGIPTLAPIVFLEWYGSPDLGELISGYIGLLLLGAMYLSSGMLASSLVRTQAIAFLTTVFAWVFVAMVPVVVSRSGGVFRPEMIEPLDPFARLRSMSMGLLDTGDLFFFIIIIALFLMATSVALMTQERA